MLYCIYVSCNPQNLTVLKLLHLLEVLYMIVNGRDCIIYKLCAICLLFLT